VSYKPVSLASLLNLRNRDLFLPHIQRPFVWEFDPQVLRFLDSLMKNFPIQTFLFWKTNDAIKARKFMDDVLEDPDLSDFYDQQASKQGKEKVFVLDGQQRLQSLFATFDGSFYGSDLYINLLEGDQEIENGLSYLFSLSNENLALPHFRIRSLTGDRRNSEDIAEELNQELSQILITESQTDRIQRERRVRKNISQLVSLIREDKHFWIEELDGTTNDAYQYKSVLNIFIRVNSGGTKLDAGDLMFAAMKEAWSDIEENIETIVGNLNASGNMSFDKVLVIKGLMLASGKGAVLSPEFFTGTDAEANLRVLEQNWATAERAFSQLRDFIYNDLKVYSDKVIRSYNAFIPIFDFFFRKPSPTPEDIADLKSYYYRSQLFNWYSARTDQILNAVHNIVATDESDRFPLAGVKDYFGRQGKDTDVTRESIQDVRLRFIILNLIYVEQMGHSPFDVAYKGNEPHIDHIYPKSKLRDRPTAQVNHIANYRYCGAHDNIRKRAEDPSSYFARLKTAGIDISRHLLVEEYINSPTLLTVDRYDDFRNKRLDKVFEICERVVNR